VKQRLAKIKAKLGPLWWYSGLLLIFSQVGNVINFYIGSVLAVDHVDQDLLGAIEPLTKLAIFITLPQAILLRTYTKFINVCHTKQEDGKIKSMLRDLFLITLVLSLATIFVLWLSRDYITTRLAFSGPYILFLVGAISILTCWAPIVMGASMGVMKFKRVILKHVIGPVARLIVILLTLKKWQLTGYLFAHFTNLFASTIFLMGGLGTYLHKSLKAVSYNEHYKEMLQFMKPMAVFTILLSVQGLVEPWVIRQRMLDDSAGYFVISRFGIIPMVFVQAISPFVFPIVSRRHERGEATSPVLIQALAMMIFIGLGSSIVLGLFGEELLSLRPSWSAYTPYAPLLFQVCMISVLTVVINTHVAHETACRRFSCLWYLTILILLEVGILYGLNKWDQLRTFVGPETHAWVEKNIANEFNFTIWFMLLTRLLIVFFAFMQVFALWRREHQPRAR
jgi:O-antigen/teichoic acid export membrane protein